MHKVHKKRLRLWWFSFKKIADAIEQTFKL